jgi:hypothetical protein
MRILAQIIPLAILFALGYLLGRNIKPERGNFSMMRWWGSIGPSPKSPPVPDPEAEAYSKRLLDERRRCSVDGCRIAMPHSHTEALLRRIREDRR